MSDIQFDFEWLDAGEAQSPELRATWSSLSIRIGEVPVTELLDMNARSYRSHVYLPLFPLAEWLASNWWFLISEVGRPDTVSSVEFDRRHNLRWGREGFALPSLRLVSVGGQFELQWQPLDYPDAGVRFVNAGTCAAGTDTVIAAIGRFIESVIVRLDDQGVHQSSLHEEWRTIQAADQLEGRFCRAAGRLGVDPYALEPDVTAAILHSGRAIPGELQDDFLSLASVEQLGRQTEALQDAAQELANDDDDRDALASLRGLAPSLSELSNSPWQAGYKFAQEFRHRLNGNDWKSRSLHELASMIGIDDIDQCLLPATGRCRFLDALAGENQRHTPKFLIEKRRESSRQFAFCRALFEYLTNPRGRFSVISGLRTDRQKMNRAFAAEFLAPHRQMASDISSPVIGDEEVTDLAEIYGVSEMVVRYQIANHELAELVS